MMKRYCLVSFCNIYLLPYARKYIDAILASGAECDLIYWDRDAVNGENDVFNGCNKILYQRKITPESSPKEKLLGYIEARSVFTKKLKKLNYDGVIFLQTHGAIACQSILKKRYEDKYIVDIRDYTLEKLPLYKDLEKAVFAKSFATVISSPAYRSFLPEHSYVIAHNYSPFPVDVVQCVRASAVEKQKAPIQISFVGTVRFIEMDKKILKAFANDERFKINYFGVGSEILEKFCKTEGIFNTEFFGSFSPDMTASFYKKTDLINNLYGNNSPFLDYALSNKLYHSGEFYIPVLVCPDTYMEEISLKYKMGFVFDVNRKDEKERLYEWYQSLDKEEFIEGCNSFISDVKKENSEFEKVIQGFLYNE